MTDGPAFEWDDAKARANLAKYGLRMEAGTAVFDDPHHLVGEDRFAEGEHRFIAIGWVGGTVLTVVFSEPAEDLTRLISVRRATGAERKAYEDQTR